MDSAPKQSHEQKLLFFEAVSDYQAAKEEQQEAYDAMIEEQKYWKYVEQPAQQERDRRATARAHLLNEARLRAEEEELRKEQTRRKLAQQADDMARRKLKKKQLDRVASETQKQISEQIALDRAEQNEEDRRKHAQEMELLAMQRKAKAESNAMKAALEAKHKARQVEAYERFKASAAERAQVCPGSYSCRVLTIGFDHMQSIHAAIGSSLAP